MRSYTGCLTCKRRKLKCDEEKPTCGPCTKAHRDCNYEERSVFRSLEICSTRRKRRRASRDQERGRLKGSPTWVKIPKDITFVNIENPFSGEGESILPAPDRSADAQEELSVHGDTSSHPKLVNENPRNEHVEYQSESPYKWSYIVPSSSQPATGPQTPEHQAFTLREVQTPESKVDSNVLVTHLLRHFREGPGQWMDLFDTTAYFSSKIPVVAASKPLLKTAVCALAAKHVRHLYLQASSSKVRTLEHSRILSLADQDIWHYESAKYYDEALGYLKHTIELGTYADSVSDKEEMLAAVAILCTYELMDAPGTAWKAHLSALPIFHDETNTESMSALSPVVIPSTAIKGPVFWSLARQDLLCAFVSETPTRLDLKDARLWHNVGLVTDEDGSLMPFDPLSLTEIRNPGETEEVIKSNELTWLLGKIANHLTSGDSLVPGDYILPRFQRSVIGLTQEHLLEKWRNLRSELESWRDCVPPTFTPTARTRGAASGSGSSLAANTFEQIWFDLPLCAATVQSYHQASILLLVNRPQESTAIRSTVSERLRSYRNILSESQYHAREICGISLANPTDPVRINSVQAIFVAGQVFEEKTEQDAVLEILTGIEEDLGWTTKYHRMKLVDEWSREDVL